MRIGLPSGTIAVANGALQDLHHPHDLTVICLYQKDLGKALSITITTSQFAYEHMKLKAILKDGCNLEHLAEILNEMEQLGDQAHPSTYATLLRRCGDTKALAEGKRIHEHVKKFHGLQRDRFIGNCLVDMYGKCGNPEDARIVFEGIEGKNVFSWTIIIAAFADSENCADALKLLQRMDQEGVKPNEITFTSIIGACSSLGSLEETSALHARIATHGLNLQVVAGTALVNAFGKCGSIDGARNVFEELPRKNAVSWTAIITAYAWNGHCKGALEFYQRMVLEGVKPDKVTFVSVLDAAASLSASSTTRNLHESICTSGFESDVVVCTALVNMYAKHGNIDAAKAVFDRMSLRNEVSWNVMIAAYAQSGHISETLSLYWKMNLEGVKPDRSSFTSVLDVCASEAALAQGKCIHGNIVVAGLGLDDPLRNVLLNMYGKCGSVDEARAVFEKICNKNVVPWTALIAAYASAGDCKEALTIFRRMELEGVEPNEVTFVVILDACTRLGVALCKQLHACVLASGFESDPFVAHTLLKMYGECGSLSDARSIFDGMRFKRNVVSWNCLIAAYAQHGYGRESLALYQMMELEGMKPNEVTFLSILCACSHVGLVELGRDYFVAFRADHGIMPAAEHYGCILDLLGRAGWLDVAEDLIDRIPFQSGGAFWPLLLGACKTHGDVERGARLAERVLEMGLNDAASYVTLSNIYAGAGHSLE